MEGYERIVEENRGYSRRGYDMRGEDMRGRGSCVWMGRWRGIWYAKRGHDRIGDTYSWNSIIGDIMRGHGLTRNIKQNSTCNTVYTIYTSS